MKFLMALGFLCVCFAEIASAKELTLTFDDAPMGDSSMMTSRQRSLAIIDALEKRKVKGSVIFANTSKLNKANQSILNEYAEADFFIANHSHSHGSAKNLGPEAYLADVTQAHNILKGTVNFISLHRFPYLNYGKTAGERAAIQDGLTKLGYRDGYVTIDNFDWSLNHHYLSALEQGKKLDLDALRALYIETLLQACDYYEAMSQQHLKTSVKHVLLLHENDLAALFIGDLVDALRNDGWSIISADDAYQGSLAKLEVEPEYMGQSKIVALAAQAGADAATLRHERENVELLAELFEKRVVMNK